MAFTCPKHLRDTWCEYLRMHNQLKKQGTADSNFNVIRFESLKNELRKYPEFNIDYVHQ